LTFALIYHDLASRAERDSVGFPGPVAGRYKVDPTDFERHLDAIAATGANVGLWEPGNGAGAALTFDDGGASALVAADALDRRGWRGHFFITTGRVGSAGFLDEGGVRELAARGHGVGGHSHSHPTYFGRLSRGEQLEEWRRSRDELARILGGEPPAGASVPGGFFTPSVAETAAEAGYAWLMTSEPESRLRTGWGLPVLGRYTIWAGTPAERAAAYARGARLARGRLWLEWNAKQRAKRVSPRAFEALRKLRAGRS
jgi:peptidoglycan/xylan/chitin deacetylase (PgdA/CDA1 family)